MNPLDFNPLLFTRIIIAVAVVLQSVELLQLRATFSDRGIWRWNTLRPDFNLFPKHERRFFDLLLAYHSFLALLVFRSIAGLLTIFYANPFILLFLLLSTLLISMRWRGTFNGGSDYMTIVVLSGLCLQAFFPSSTTAALAAIYYIALQACLSYFIAGVVKLRCREWREGSALRAFIVSGTYAASERIREKFTEPRFALAASWAVILFECLFPVALLSPLICVPFVLAAFAFHLGNVYFLGLNRFLFAWMATYPVLLWCSGR